MNTRINTYKSIYITYISPPPASTYGSPGHLLVEQDEDASTFAHVDIFQNLEKLVSRLLDAARIRRIDHVDERVRVHEVVAPQRPQLRLSSYIPGDARARERVRAADGEKGRGERAGSDLDETSENNANERSISKEGNARKYI